MATDLIEQVGQYDMKVGRCGDLSRAHDSCPEVRGSNVSSWPRHISDKVARISEVAQQRPVGEEFEVHAWPGSRQSSRCSYRSRGWRDVPIPRCYVPILMSRSDIQMSRC